MLQESASALCMRNTTYSMLARQWMTGGQRQSETSRALPFNSKVYAALSLHHYYLAKATLAQITTSVVLIIDIRCHGELQRPAST